MPKIDQDSEKKYLEFVQENISLREDELEEMHKNASAVAADGKSQQKLREFYREAQVPDPDNPYFVRVDLSNGEVRYYGYQKLRQTTLSSPVPKSHEAVDDLLVLSSRSDGRGYTADYPENLPDLVARTRFMIQNGKIVKISEEFFDGSREEHSVVAAEIVTESIEKTRKKKMQPISSTLQPDQFLITREPISHSLAIQGPPGSGKTAVLLERLARIAFADEAVSRKGMLLIGPNKPFMEYVSQVLPTLGENDIALKSIDELSEFSKNLNSPSVETEGLIYIKGSEDMKLLLENLVESQIRVLSKSSYIKILDVAIEFTSADSFKMIQSIEEDSYPNFTQKRKVAETRVRNLLVERFQEAWISQRGDLRGLQGDPTQMINQESAFRTIIRNMYPNIDPVGLLSKLKSDATFFMENAKNILDSEDLLTWIEEAELQASKVTPSDIPILDYLDFLLNDPIRKWGHIAIDEAQDLTPMELAMISRRLDTNATLSLAGDLAQATGTHYYESWHGILLLLEQEFEYSQKELTRSYRVPSEILEYAQQFLVASKVDVSASEPFLERENSLEFSEIEAKNLQNVDAIARATEHLANKESVLILAPKNDREIFTKHVFPDNGNAHVRVMDPTEVKGLEFDAVIIVNPESILAEYPWSKSRLARLFYVLTTRSTKKLVLIGPELELLKSPLFNIEDEEEIEEIDSELTSGLTDESIIEFIESVSDDLKNGFVGSPQAVELIPEVLELSLEIPTISILKLCQDLKVDLKQVSGEYLDGHWIFAGMSQVRCYECGEKPQMIFLKHKDGFEKVPSEGHHFALVCPGCSVIRDYENVKHGPLENIVGELKIKELIASQCLQCGDE
jgi:DNA helicase IV